MSSAIPRTIRYLIYRIHRTLRTSGNHSAGCVTVVIITVKYRTDILRDTLKDQNKPFRIRQTGFDGILKYCSIIRGDTRGTTQRRARDNMES